MPAIRAGGFSVVSLPGSSRPWHSLSRLSRFPIALKLLKNRHAMQASVYIQAYMYAPPDPTTNPQSLLSLYPPTKD